jgi:ubiquinone/menaquinone biosynthesis C-methylase UbiE
LQEQKEESAMSSLPDWQLPPGVSRGLWDYLHNAELAQGYDASLADTPLLRLDQDFVLAHCRPPGRFLDLGCGTGRLLLTLARHGYHPVGVDLSPAMLRVARAKAKEAGLAVELLEANIAELDVLADRSFDHAACLFSTLGMVSGSATRRRVVAHAFRLLRPGGVFVLHVHNRWFNFWDPQGRKWLFRNLFASLAGRAEPGDMIMATHQGVANLPLHLFTRREAMRLLTSAGFALREVRPLSLRADGRLACWWWFGWLRAYGYLIAAVKPAA